MAAEDGSEVLIGPEELLEASGLSGVPVGRGVLGLSRNGSSRRQTSVLRSPSDSVERRLMHTDLFKLTC